MPFEVNSAGERRETPEAPITLEALSTARSDGEDELKHLEKRLLARFTVPGVG